MPNLKSSSREEIARGQRQALNALIQGTAADIIKQASISIANILRETTHLSKIRLMAQIHDELLFSVPKGALQEFVPLLRSQMEARGRDLKVPLYAKIHFGSNYGSLVEW